ncbi:tetratricopeptide repeat protein [Sphaerimonospora cavernae]|uniref:Tetratricopeptide repeat protein n=1 Tax=Sphaerimonospora cavernae TaxID=1740611 RepID=A0ABV6TYV2_9ACTN
MTLSRLPRALAATIVLIGTVAGFPVVFYRFAGSPLPDHIPNLQEVLDRLTARDDGTLFIAVLEFLAWGAWALFSTSVIVEIGARVAGRRFEPRLPGLRTLQRLAAYLVASASLVAVAPAAMAAVDAAPPPVIAMAPVHALGEVVADKPVPAHEQVYSVRQGDSLWKIADRKLGSPGRWQKIWKLNAGSAQPGGHRFTNPGVIRPGWKLRLPEQARKAEREEPPAVRSTAEPVRNAAPAAASPAQTPVAEREHHSVVELSSGSLVALGYAAGISTAYLSNRLRRRRRHVPPSIAEPVEITPEPKPDPAVEELRRAHLRSFTERGEKPPSDAELLQEAQSIDAPEDLAVGRRADGSAVEIRLASPGLGLIGDGAHDVARYLILEVLRQSSNFRAEVVVCGELAESLLGVPADELCRLAASFPGLVITSTADGALKHFEQTFFTRTRMLLEREASDIEELREQDPGEVLPTVVLVAEVDDEVFDRVSAPLVSRTTAGVGALLLGEWPSGTTCELSGDHHVVHVTGRLAAAMAGAQLFHVTECEAAAHLKELLPAEDVGVTEEPSSSKPAPASWDGPQLVRLSILGPLTVHVSGRSEPLELGWLQLNALVYLALHDDGVTRERLTTALWPDDTGKDVHNTLRHLRNALVTASGYENRDRKRAPFINASTTQEGATYRIDPALVSIDLWDYQAALDEVRAVSEPTAKLAALTKAAELCGGELAQGLETEWIEEHRYPLTRSQADLLTQLAEHHAEEDPEQALEALERARALDPDAEETYLRIARLQLRLKRRDEARRTVELLRQRLSGLGAPLSARTEKLLSTLFTQEA